MKRIISAMLSFLLLCQLFTNTVFAMPEWPSDTGIMADGGIVVDMDSGAVIYGQRIRVGYFPASITKLLTALVVLEHAELDDIVTFSNDAVNNVESGSGNKLKIEVGDKLSVKDCLYMLLLVSSNQAGNALAEHVAGSRDDFVDMMNEKIKELGCTDSHFKNPSGLNDPEQIVTPYDMSLIARACFSNSQLLEIASSKKYRVNSTINNPDGANITMEHKMLVESDYTYEGAIAGKTGFTSLAGNTLVTLAERDGRRLIAIVLKGSQPQYYIDDTTLLDFGFNKFKNMNVAEYETEYTSGDEEIQVGAKSYASSDLLIDPAAVVTLPKDAEFTDLTKSLHTELTGDYPEGAVAFIQYSYNDRKVGNAYLCLKDPVVQAGNSDSGASEGAAGGTPEALDKPDKTPAETDQAGLPLFVKILLGTGAAIVLGAGITIAVMIYRRRKEEEWELAMRRERRRQRLKESGYSEADFNKILQERKGRVR